MEKLTIQIVLSAVGIVFMIADIYMIVKTEDKYDKLMFSVMLIMMWTLTNVLW